MLIPIYLQTNFLLLRNLKESSMKKLLFILLGFAGAIAILIITISSNLKQSILAYKALSTNRFVVMKLFTSQGCSSCPPADELLDKYATQNKGNIIPLSFHVDYWNRLGRKDSFSTSDYSQRQHQDAQTFSNSSVYTSQVVINGTKEIIGSDENKVDEAEAVGEIPIASITIKGNEITGDKIALQYSTTGNIANSNILALLVQNKALIKIKAGENDGAMLTSYNVVRSIVSSSAKTEGSCILPIPLNISLKDVSLVLFIQNKTSLKIAGAIKMIL